MSLIETSSKQSVVSISEAETSTRCRVNVKDKTDPGACRHGNFINYYQFHPAEERLHQLPRGQDVWHAVESSDRKYVGIDVGCNAGDLTIALYDFLTENILGIDISLLGVDLDSILIERAKESKIISNSIVKRDVIYKCVDFMSDKERNEIINVYLADKGRNIFDVAFCFSITMWIHLNHGDLGLVKFLKSICEMTRLIIVEPQPWKCYRNACRRMRRANIDNVPNLEKIKYKKDVEKYVEDILKGPDCRFEKITETVNNEWGRKLLIYKQKGTR